ncbi:uncharacterized protein METZ01_LOCUS216036 [marine metagenome]|uniref:Neck protein n=1 Tax=marine metagenome TaxID=408172 RepID=A0A382FKN6_9ZZZZ
MAVNSFFHTNNNHALATEKSLYQDLLAEAIQIYGHDVYYLDRTLTNEDTLFGEDNLAKFTTQNKIEMYVESNDGFAGERALMTQFGLTNLSEITFTVSKARFQDLTKQMTIESGTDTLSGSIQLEAASLDSTVVDISSSYDGGYLISEATSTEADRPLEGDLIYHPILDKIFQINFVDKESPFYQLDDNPSYKLSCRLFDYSSEIIDTDVAAIDAVETEHTLDALGYQMTLEQTAFVNENIRLEIGISSNGDQGLLLEETSGDNLIGENDTSSVGESIILENPADSGDDAYLLNEDYVVGDMSQDKTTQNELFDSLDDDVLDFSERNPFGDAGGT